MIKLARYLKNYLPLLALAVVLLIGQTLLDLSLPGKMSNIVNVGIQNGGVEETAPKVIPGEAYGMLTLFMGADDMVVFQSGYTNYTALTEAGRREVDAGFPRAFEEGAMVLSAPPQQRGAVGDAFGRTCYAFMAFLEGRQEGMAAAAGQEAYGPLNAMFTGEGMKRLMQALLQAPEEAFTAAVNAALTAPKTAASTAAAAVTRAFYSRLGADAGEMQMGYIMRVGADMLLFTFAAALCAIGAGFCFSRIGAGVARDLRRDVFAKVCGFSGAEMDKFSTASLITRTTNDVTHVQMLYTMGMRMMIYAPIMGVGGIVMALRRSVGMSWVIGAAVGVITVLIAVLMAAVMPRFRKMQALLDRLNLVAREGLSGIMVVRAFSNQKFQRQRFQNANRELTENSLFAGRAINLMMPFMMLTMNGVSLFIIWVGAKQVAASAIQVGDIMAFLQYAMQVIMSFLMIAMIFVMVPRASVSAGRINEVLRSESAVKDPESPSAALPRSGGEVEFCRVSFRYQGAEEDALHDISFTARAGQTTAIVGATGSGKTTLVSLIPRFYDVSGGQVKVDGLDVRQYSQRELRGKIGYVPQKALLFSGDVAFNLRFGKSGAAKDELVKAAEIAQADKFIGEMEGGFSAAVAQGGLNVSGGQRQRLAIARALVKKPPVYIFDDSFSALDFSTDARLRAALAPHTRESAVIVVTQRISTIMKAEQIVVLEDGRMAGIGTHSQLMRECGAYREIARSQFGEEGAV